MNYSVEMQNTSFSEGKTLSQTMGSFFSGLFKNDAKMDKSDTYSRSSVKRNKNLQEHQEMNISHVVEKNEKTQMLNTRQQELMEGFFQQFQSQDQMYEYLINIGKNLITDKERGTQFFRRVQQQFANQFFNQRILRKEVEELDLLKHFLKLRVQQMKQKMVISEKEKREAERMLLKERELKDKAASKANDFERRYIELINEI